MMENIQSFGLGIAYVILGMVLLLIAIWKFFAVADRMPGGAGSYMYLPIAMAGFIVLAGVRLVRAYHLFRLGPRPLGPGWAQAHTLSGD